MKLQGKIFGLLILLFLFGCSKNENTSFESVKEQVVDTQTEQSEVINIERKLIKEGWIAFETDDINSTRKLVFKNIKKHNGYTSSDIEQKSIGQISNTITIRVPAKNFDLLLSDVTKGVTKFDSKNIEIKDVTEEFLDIQARLKTKKELESRYLELLEKANNVTEILEIEKEMGLLRSEIESIEGRLKYLESNVSLSTLTMTFYQMIPNETKFIREFKNGLKNGWENLIWFFISLINFWPFILIGIGLIFGNKIWKKRK